MRELCQSSELYPVDPYDINILKDGSLEDFKHQLKDKVVVLIGDSQAGQKDTLLCGREIILEAIKNNIPFIPIRFAFITKINRFDILTVFIKPLRARYKIFSSNIYHMNPMDIRHLKIERNIRTRKNAYIFSNPLYYFDANERKKRYDELYKSMQKGYDDNFPLDIMLLRMMGIKDTVNQGHHRMGIAVECKLPRVAVRFSAAGASPKILKPLLKIIANINITLKLWSKNK